MWMVYFEEQWNEHTKLDWQLAQLSVDIRKGPLQNAEKLEPKDGFMKFDKEAPKEDEEEGDNAPPPDQIKKKMDVSKAYWLTLAGVNSKGKLKTRKAPGPKGKE